MLKTGNFSKQRLSQANNLQKAIYLDFESVSHNDSFKVLSTVDLQLDVHSFSYWSPIGAIDYGVILEETNEEVWQNGTLRRTLNVGRSVNHIACLLKSTSYWCSAIFYHFFFLFQVKWWRGPLRTMELLECCLMELVNLAIVSTVTKLSICCDKSNISFLISGWPD